MLPPPLPASSVNQPASQQPSSSGVRSVGGVSHVGRSQDGAATGPAVGAGGTTAEPRSREGGARAAIQEQPVVFFTPPVMIQRGMFQGKWMRFELSVMQEPVLGRRKTEKDRRPIGPAPILRFRAVQCRLRVGTQEWDEQELEASQFDTANLVCSAELCAPEEPLQPSRDPTAKDKATAHSPASGPTAGSFRQRSSAHAPNSTPSSLKPDTPTAGSIGGAQAGDSKGEPPPPLLRRTSSWPFTVQPTSEAEDNDRSAPKPPGESETSTDRQLSAVNEGNGGDHSRYPHIEEGEYISAESLVALSVGDGAAASRVLSSAPPGAVRGMSETSSYASAGAGGAGGASRNLYGSLHVVGVKVICPDMETQGMWFLFTDLSVRQEGTYALRFRCFDLTASTPAHGEFLSPELVSCLSQPFKVYSPRMVPMLPKPTELAEHFAKQGFKLNTRKNERTVGSPPPSTPTPAAAPSAASSPAPQTISRPLPHPLQTQTRSNAPSASASPGPQSFNSNDASTPAGASTSVSASASASLGATSASDSVPTFPTSAGSAGESFLSGGSAGGSSMLGAASAAAGSVGSTGGSVGGSAEGLAGRVGRPLSPLQTMKRRKME